MMLTGLLSFSALFPALCMIWKGLKSLQTAKNFSVSHTWRLYLAADSDSDLASVNASNLKAALQNVLHDDEGSVSISHLSLARESLRLCSTVSVTGSHPKIQQGVRIDVEVPLGGTSCRRLRLTPDDRFIGMTTLYDRAATPATVEVVAVSGLASHAFGSFKAPGNSQDNWLRDFLPDLIPDSRILLYGYDTDLVRSDGKESIMDLARKLLESLNNHHLSDRPIIFIGHSLGGLLIKEALCLAMDGYKHLFECCCGLIFFGVPNLGLNHTALNVVVGDQPAKKLIQDLVVDGDNEASSYLNVLNRSFDRCCKKQNFEIIAFYERIPTATVEASHKFANLWKHLKSGQFSFEEGTWTRSGPKVLMVTEQSATSISRQHNPKNSVPLKTDHRNLVKFHHENDSNLKDVVGPKIAELVSKAPEKMKQKFVLGHDLTPEQKSVRLKITPAPLDEVISQRISDPHQDTLRWFLYEEEFTCWRDSIDRPCFWISGSPGQGKSVLAKYLVYNLETDSKCRDTPYTVIKYFCYNQDDHFRKPLSILQTLVIQLLDCREAFELFPPKYHDWEEFLNASQAHLWDTFQNLVLGIRRNVVYCLIDALDECEPQGNQREDLTRRLVNLCSKESKRFRLLITSRPGEKDIEKSLGQMRRYVLRSRIEDVKSFVQSQVHNLPSEFNEEMKMEILRMISLEVQNTFLWVSVIIKSISELELPSLHIIRDILHSTPKDLNELYQHLFKRLSREKMLAKILLWVAFSSTALSLKAIADALTYDPFEKEYTSLSEMEEYRVEISEEFIHRKLGTLLEITNVMSDPNRYEIGDELRGLQKVVTFNHQSVRDFFNNCESSTFGNLSFLGDYETHSYLARVSMWYLNAREILDLSHFTGALEDTRYFHSFTRCASINWIHKMNLKLAESEIAQALTLIGGQNKLLKQCVFMLVEDGLLSYTKWQILENDCQPKPIDVCLCLDLPWIMELIILGKIQGNCLSDNDIRAMIIEAPYSFDVLCRKYEDIQIPKQTLENGLHPHGSIVGLKSLLKYRRKELCIHSGLIRVAIEHSNIFTAETSLEKVRLLLEQPEIQEQLELTREICDLAAKKDWESKDAAAKEDLELILKFAISLHELLESLPAVKDWGSELIHKFLDFRAVLAKPPEEMRGLSPPREWSRTAWVQRALEPYQQPQISSEVVKAAVEADSLVGREMLRAFFHLHNEQVQITDETFNLSLRQRVYAADYVRLFFEYQSEHIQLTDKSIELAVLNSTQVVKLLSLVLEHRGGQKHLTNKIMRTCLASGVPELWNFCFERLNDHIPKIDEFVMHCVMERRTNIRQQLAEVLFRYRYEDIKDDEGLVKTACANRQYEWWVEMFNEHLSKQMSVSQEVIKVALAINRATDLMKLFFRHRSEQSIINEEVMKAAVGNDLCGAQVIGLFFMKRNQQKRITDDILKIATTNRGQGSEIVRLFLHYQNEQVNVNEEIVKAAVANKGCGAGLMQRFFRHRNKQIQITDDVLNMTSQNPSPEERRKLFSLFLEYREDQMKTILRRSPRSGLKYQNEVTTILQNLIDEQERSRRGAISTLGS